MQASEAMAVIQELAGRSDLTGEEKQQLHSARLALGEDKEPVSEGTGEQPSLDPEVIRTLDPLQLTGQQKAVLGGGGGGGRMAGAKPRPRAALTPDGRDPRTLTGAEKRSLGYQHKQRAARELPPPPVVVSGALTAQEHHELGMLRAGQGTLGDRATELLAVAEADASPEVRAAGARLELAIRRYSPRN